MSSAQPKTPNMDKLFTYLQKSQWHNVSANFSGFVRKEFEATMDKLDEDEDNFNTLRRMIEFSEMGRFSEAKDMIEPAHKEYQLILNEMRELQLAKKHSPRRQHDKFTPHHEEGRTMFSPKEGRTVYSAGKRNTQSPDKQRNYEHTRAEEGSPRRFHEITERSPRSPIKMNDDSRHDPHKDNYDSLRLKSPEKRPVQQQQPQEQLYSSPRTDRLKSPGGLRSPDRLKSPGGLRSPERLRSPEKPSSRHGIPRQPGTADSGRNRPENGNKQNKLTPDHPQMRAHMLDQFASSNALWGREHGDKASEKVGDSTYRQSYHQYPVENHERLDRERYRENFGSLAERTNWARGQDETTYNEDGRKSQRATPDLDVHRPSELAKKFREIYNNEWRDAYDEICAGLGSEKTARHLLWVVTEASLIASDIGDRQLKDLEKQAFGVMTTPGPDNHPISFAPRNLGETLPVSRALLVRYRKQTALLSVPYVRQECRDKISRTLLESGVSKQYLNDASRLVTYINKCAEIVWTMSIQDPPIVMEYISKDTEGARFNQDHYSPYTSMGNFYDYGVWPLLRLHKKGPVISKGIAQGI